MAFDVPMNKKRSLFQTRKEWTRKAIQKAAKDVFLKKGYLNTTIEEIAARARVSKGAIYIYFNSKDDLYLSLIMPVQEEIYRLFIELDKKLDDEQWMDARSLVMGFFDVFNRLYKNDPDGIRIIQTFQIGNLTSKMTEETAAEVYRTAKRNFDAGRSIIAKAIRFEVIREVSPVKLFDSMWGMFIGIVQLEESKLRATQKNYIQGTLEYAFSCLVDNLRIDRTKGPYSCRDRRTGEK